MSKNQYTPIENIPPKETLEALVSNLGYARLSIEQLPEVLTEHELFKKFNSVIIAHTGSNDISCFTLIGLRLDYNNKKIDEHPIVIGFDEKNPLMCYAGIIHHGNWNSRTIDLSYSQTYSINQVGINADIIYKGIHLHSSGSIYKLKDNGMLDGVNKQVGILLKKNNLI